MRRAIAICSAVLGISVLPASAAFASPATFSDQPPPGAVTITQARPIGSGCKPGTTEVDMASDKTAITVRYSEYIASIGAGTGVLDFRKNCQIAADIHVPQGFTYAIASADYRGFASLQGDVSAVQGANYYFSGEPQTTIIKHRIPGPLANPWITHDKVPFASLEFARCGGGRNLNINTSLLLEKGQKFDRSKTSTIGMDSSDLDLKTVYNLTWKKCKP